MQFALALLFLGSSPVHCYRRALEASEQARDDVASQRHPTSWREGFWKIVNPQTKKCLGTDKWPTLEACSTLNKSQSWAVFTKPNNTILLSPAMEGNGDEVQHLLSSCCLGNSKSWVRWGYLTQRACFPFRKRAEWQLREWGNKSEVQLFHVRTGRCLSAMRRGDAHSADHSPFLVSCNSADASQRFTFEAISPWDEQEAERRTVKDAELTPVFEFVHKVTNKTSIHTGVAWRGELRQRFLFHAFSRQIAGTKPVYAFLKSEVVYTTWRKRPRMNLTMAYSFHMGHAREGEVRARQTAEFYAYPAESQGTKPVMLVRCLAHCSDTLALKSGSGVGGAKDETPHSRLTGQNTLEAGATNPLLSGTLDLDSEIAFHAYPEVPPGFRFQRARNLLLTLNDVIDLHMAVYSNMTDLVAQHYSNSKVITTGKGVNLGIGTAGAVAALLATAPVSAVLLGVASVSSLSSAAYLWWTGDSHVTAFLDLVARAEASRDNFLLQMFLVTQEIHQKMKLGLTDVQAAALTLVGSDTMVLKGIPSLRTAETLHDVGSYTNTVGQQVFNFATGKLQDTLAHAQYGGKQVLSFLKHGGFFVANGVTPCGTTGADIVSGGIAAGGGAVHHTGLGLSDAQTQLGTTTFGVLGAALSAADLTIYLWNAQTTKEQLMTRMREFSQEVKRLHCLANNLSSQTDLFNVGERRNQLINSGSLQCATSPRAVYGVVPPMLPCENADAQLWRLSCFLTVMCQVKNDATKECLYADAEGVVLLQPCRDHSAQVWELLDQTDAPEENQTMWALRNRYSGMCLRQKNGMLSVSMCESAEHKSSGLWHIIERDQPRMRQTSSEVEGHSRFSKCCCPNNGTSECISLDWHELRTSKWTYVPFATLRKTCPYGFRHFSDAGLKELPASCSKTNAEECSPGDDAVVEAGRS